MSETKARKNLISKSVELQDEETINLPVLNASDLKKDRLRLSIPDGETDSTAVGIGDVIEDGVEGDSRRHLVIGRQGRRFITFEIITRTYGSWSQRGLIAGLTQTETNAIEISPDPFELRDQAFKTSN